MAERKKNQIITLIAIAVGIIILIVVLFLSLGGAAGNKETVDQVQAGKSYLAELEKKDPAVVKDIRKDIYTQKVVAQREELIRQIEAGELDPFSLFSDYALLGDSRAVGYWYWEFLETSRVLADGGNTILKIPEHLETLKELNPSYVFLCYGLNDCSIGIWSSGEEYAADYMDMVQQIRDVLPEATIVVSSIPDVQEVAYATSSRWHSIPEWNDILEQTCQENGVPFANCDVLHENYSDYWDIDGFHFREALYPYWATILIETALRGAEIDYAG